MEIHELRRPDGDGFTFMGLLVLALPELVEVDALGSLPAAVDSGVPFSCLEFRRTGDAAGFAAGGVPFAFSVDLVVV